MLCKLLKLSTYINSEQKLITTGFSNSCNKLKDRISIGLDIGVVVMNSNLGSTLGSNLIFPVE